MANWQVSGDYFETCNCDYLCPCISTNLAGKATHGYCDVAMVFHINQGSYDSVSLNGLNFAVVIHAPEPAMGSGNLTVGLITDERATSEQQNALVQIGSGQGGGPIAALGPLVGKMAGVEARPISFEKDGLNRSVSVPGVVDQALVGVTGGDPNEPIYLDKTIHPANTRIALAKATRTHIHIFGIDLDNTSGQNNGHFAPFNWKS